MGSNLTPIDKSMTKEKAISQGGYYNTDGDWNNVLTLNDYPGKIFRGRVEVLILKEGKLFMFLKENGKYRIPGGGFDRGVLNKDQAFIETKEEAKIIIGNIRYTGVTYVHLYDEIWGNSEDAILYDGTYSEVYIADYKADYEGYIRKGLSDMELTNKGKFYDIDEIKDILKEPHKQALMNILNNVVTEAAKDNITTTIQQLQNTLRGLHNIFDCYNCIQNRDIEYDDGLIFAEYIAETPKEISDVKSFVMYCTDKLQKTIPDAYIEEPVSYKGHGFLFVKFHVKEETYFIDEQTFLMEAAQYTDKYPIFIVNSFTDTPFGKLIKAYTHSVYTHSSIALSTALDKLYSFNANNGHKFGGFSVESLSSYCQYNDQCKIQVNCIFVKKRDYQIIKEKIEYLWKNNNLTKYGFDNILNIIFNKAAETSEATQEKISMICSEFVAWILSLAEIKIIDKPANLITPKDLSTINNPKIYKLYDGPGIEYDKKKIDRMFNKLKQHSELIK